MANLSKNTTIYPYADGQGLARATLIATLTADLLKGKEVVCLCLRRRVAEFR
jgi:hypothetical protein